MIRKTGTPRRTGSDRPPESNRLTFTQTSAVQERIDNAQLTIDYLKPIDVEQEIVVEAFEEQQSGRNLFQVGEIRNAAGEVLAKGKARFVMVRPAHGGGEQQKSLPV